MTVDIPSHYSILQSLRVWAARNQTPVTSPGGLGVGRHGLVTSWAVVRTGPRPEVTDVVRERHCGEWDWRLGWRGVVFPIKLLEFFYC